nr:NADH dehydrogenase subunit 6 [Monopis longella]
MMKIILTILLMFFMFFSLFLNHPMSMGLMILIQTLLISMISGMMISSYWFSYILFLTFMGGMLILFIYMTSISPNNLINMNFMKNMIILLFSIIIIITLISYLMFYNLNWLNFYFNSEMNNFFDKFIFFNNENKLNLSKLYNEKNFIFMFLMIIYLFITLIATIKITNIFYGPLRKNFYDK